MLTLLLYNNLHFFISIRIDLIRSISNASQNSKALFLKKKQKRKEKEQCLKNDGFVNVVLQKLKNCINFSFICIILSINYL